MVARRRYGAEVDPMHELPEEIVLVRDEYRLQHAALEIALDVLDRFPESDPDGQARQAITTAMRSLLHRIWPMLGDLDGED